MTINWSRSLIGQLEFYWDAHLRPRLDGLTDKEYFWEPVDGCWSLRPAGDGRWRMDKPEQPTRSGAFTTIAWRMTHVSVEVFQTGPWPSSPARDRPCGHQANGSWPAASCPAAPRPASRTSNRRTPAGGMRSPG